ncbi:MAG TPA: alpha/beta hydrolase [Rhodocyclaceae bacterium]|nr:alpha/beta hydrolase [Rhodocyclaceae bacterium]
MKNPIYLLRLLLLLGAALLTAAPATAQQAQEKLKMKNIVLVHGAWADGSGWQRVHELLRAKGYAVSIVQNSLTSLAADVAAVQRVLARQDGPALLVGHSYGGVVITEAGNAPNVAGLVYVAAFVPDAGESVASLLDGGAAPPVQPSADGYLFFDASIFPQAFAQDLPPAQGAFLAAAQIPPAAAAFEAKVSQAAWKTRRSWYVLSTEDRIIPPPAQRKMAGRAKASIKEVRASHAVYISQPDAVAQAIDDAARAAAQ